MGIIYKRRALRGASEEQPAPSWLQGPPGPQGEQGPVGPIGPPSTWADLQGKPSTFPPAPHTHDWNQITGKPDSLEGLPTINEQSTITPQVVVDGGNAIGVGSDRAVYTWVQGDNQWRGIGYYLPGGVVPDPADPIKYPYAYGVRLPLASNPTTALVPIGHQYLLDSKPVHARMARCLQQGDAVRFLDPADSSKYLDGTAAALDGSQGNVMVYIPSFYYRFEDTPLGVEIWISDRPVAGFLLAEERTVGAFEMAASRATVYGKPANSGWSIRNVAPEFRGGNNNATLDATPQSMLGMPVTTWNRTQFLDAAKAQGMGWGIMDYQTHCVLWWLFVTDFYTTRVEDTPLGIGVVNDTAHEWGASTWNAWNGYYPFIPCGRTVSLGDSSGKVPYTVNGRTFQVPSFRGIENPFGHIWENTIGVNIWRSGSLCKAYVYDDPIGDYEANSVALADRSFDFQRYTGWMKTLVLGPRGDVLPLEVGASSSTYITDYYDAPSSVSDGVFTLLRSGGANYGASTGFACARSSYYGSANTPAHVGARLCRIGRVRPVAAW